MEIRNGSCIYQVGKMVAEAGNFRLYLCTQDATGRQCLLQIATTGEHNGGLQRAAYVLKEIQRRADELEAEYAREKEDSKVLLNYQLGFPELVDSFSCSEQGGRQINILAFRNVENVSQMVPLINLTEKDRLRVDLRTSAWIMGKTLKLLIFLFSEGFSVEPTGNNILLEPDQHYVVIFDLSAAQVHLTVVPIEMRRRAISQAARAAIIACGGDLTTGIFPDDSDETLGSYTEYLLRLARGAESNAQRAHTAFYKIVDSIWERKFYPFTTKPLAA